MGHRRRVGVVVMAVAALGLATACEPQMEIQLALHRDGRIGAPDGEGGRTVVLTGVSWCTRVEPVDLFPTLTQGALVVQPGEISVPCGPKRREWSASFSVEALEPGATRVDVVACTNPAEPIDEDCVSLGRSVELTAMG